MNELTGARTDLVFHCNFNSKSYSHRRYKYNISSRLIARSRLAKDGSLHRTPEQRYLVPDIVWSWSADRLSQ